MPVWVTAGLWGLLGASSLILGAAAAYLIELPERITAGIMAFGCGVLISAVAYDLLEDGFQRGNWPIIAGAITAGCLHAGRLADLSKRWPRPQTIGRPAERQRRRRWISHRSRLSARWHTQSVVLGGSLLGGQSISVAMLAAIFLSNFPKGLSSAVGMKNRRRTVRSSRLP